jgi:hypothetical protein
MFATPIHRTHERVTVPGTFVPVNEAGEALAVAIRLSEGEKLPELVTDDVTPVGYIRIGQDSTA